MQLHARVDPLDRSQCAAMDAASQLRDDRTVVRALRILQHRASKAGQAMSDVATCGAFFRLRLAHETRQHFEVAFLDTQHRLLAVERLFSGTIDGANVYPRIVLQRALALNSGAVILAHNHPSGNQTRQLPIERSRHASKRLLAWSMSGCWITSLSRQTRRYRWLRGE